MPADRDLPHPGSAHQPGQPSLPAAVPEPGEDRQTGNGHCDPGHMAWALTASSNSDPKPFLTDPSLVLSSLVPTFVCYIAQEGSEELCKYSG